MNLEARKKLGEVVKIARNSMSQRAFAKLLGVSYTTVQLWEKGESIPDVVNLSNIADRAGYTMEELLNYLGVKHQPQSSDVNQIVKQIQVMPLSQVAIIAKAAVERFASAAATSGEEVKAS
ncbi:MAG: helix-turn-helix domain-containing protein [Scytonematopsis contorta HA4267-MV1]|nr:helix-turn-helix domain-containing protein [Scytonematopsis contorta HA4267-MV1]